MSLFVKRPKRNMENFEIIYLVKLGVDSFVAILFLQSGFDKVLDYKRNKSYIITVFSKTPLNSLSGLLLIGITALEVLTGIMALAGVVQLLFYHNQSLSIYALLLAMISLLALFSGQRIAKDYGGAAGIVPYFILVVFSLFIFAQ